MIDSCYNPCISVEFALLQEPEFDWSSSVVGLIDSSFFWGYIVTQIPGGYLASRMPAHRYEGFLVEPGIAF